MCSATGRIWSLCLYVVYDTFSLVTYYPIGSSPRTQKITAPLRKCGNYYFFPCAANRLHNRVTDWGQWKGTAAGLRSNHVQQEQIAQGLIQPSFEYVQGWRSHSLPGQLFQCFITLITIIFSCYQSHNFSCFKLSLLPFILLLYTSPKGLAPSSLNTPN